MSISSINTSTASTAQSGLATTLLATTATTTTSSSASSVGVSPATSKNEWLKIKVTTSQLSGEQLFKPIGLVDTFSTPKELLNNNTLDANKSVLNTNKPNQLMKPKILVIFQKFENLFFHLN